MNNRNRAIRQVIDGKTEYSCHCGVRLKVKTSTTRTNLGKRFVKCVVCQVYEFLDDDHPSEYYQELLFGLLQKEKRWNNTVNYQPVIDAIALEKSIMEEELNDMKSKFKLYERFFFFFLLGSFSVVCVGFGMLIGK